MAAIDVEPERDQHRAAKRCHRHQIALDISEIASIPAEGVPRCKFNSELPNSGAVQQESRRRRASDQDRLRHLPADKDPKGDDRNHQRCHVVD